MTTLWSLWAGSLSLIVLVPVGMFLWFLAEVRGPGGGSGDVSHPFAAYVGLAGMAASGIVLIFGLCVMIPTSFAIAFDASLNNIMRFGPALVTLGLIVATKYLKDSLRSHDEVPEGQFEASLTRAGCVGGASVSATDQTDFMRIPPVVRRGIDADLPTDGGTGHLPQGHKSPQRRRVQCDHLVPQRAPIPCLYPLARSW